MPGQGLLQRLMPPDELAAFFARDWGRRLRHWPGGLEACADLLIGLDGFEDALARLNRAHEGWLHFADQGLKAVPPDFVRPEGYLDMAKVATAFAANQTLYLTKAECVMAPLARACTALQHELADRGISLRERVNAHLFLTPRASQGFAPHRDAHASFILQCEGRKSWKIYVPRAREPAAYQKGGVSAEVLAGHDLSEVTLEQGDILYMPEWWPHEACAKNAHSLHATLRVFPLRYCDLMERVVANSALLSEPVPAGPGERAAETLAAMIASQAFRDDLLRAIPLALSDSAQPPEPPRQKGLLRRVLEAEQIDLETTLVRNPALACDIRESDETAVLSFADSFVRGPRMFLSVFEFVAENARFRPIDLPEIDAQYDRLEVSRRLFRDGLLGKDAQ